MLESLGKLTAVGMLAPGAGLTGTAVTGTRRTTGWYTKSQSAVYPGTSAEPYGYFCRVQALHIGFTLCRYVIATYNDGPTMITSACSGRYHSQCTTCTTLDSRAQVPVPRTPRTLWYNSVALSPRACPVQTMGGTADENLLANVIALVLVNPLDFVRVFGVESVDFPT